MQAKLCIGALAILMLVACEQRGADGLSRKGAIRPITDPSAEVITSDRLTDADALFATLQGIRDQAPPQDYTSAASVAARQSHYRQQLHLLLPEGARVLLPLGCHGSEDAPLTFDPNSRNLVVNLSSYDAGQARSLGDDGRRYLQEARDVLLADQRVITLTGDSVLDHADLELPPDRRTALSEFAINAHIRRLPGGTRLAIMNNPVNGWHLRLEADVSEARLEHAQFKLARLRGQSGELAAVADVFRRASSDWLTFPITSAMRPFFYQRIPYRGSPDGLCVIGAFRHMDLRSGGEWASPLTGDADLVGDLDEWWIIDRASGRIVHTQADPSEHDS